MVDDINNLESVGILLAFAVLYYQNFRQNKKVVNVEETLTTKDGGVASIKRQLDRIEKKSQDTENELSKHMDWSDTYVRTTNERLGKIETILISRATPTTRRRWFF